MNVSINPKFRNAIAGFVVIATIVLAAFPDISAFVTTPKGELIFRGISLAIAIAVKVGNQLIIDSTPHPTPPAGPVGISYKASTPGQS